jgi:hypothetical protein
VGAIASHDDRLGYIGALGSLATKWRAPQPITAQAKATTNIRRISARMPGVYMQNAQRL